MKCRIVWVCSMWTFRRSVRICQDNVYTWLGSSIAMTLCGQWELTSFSGCSCQWISVNHSAQYFSLIAACYVHLALTWRKVESIGILFIFFNTRVIVNNNHPRASRQKAMMSSLKAFEMYIPYPFVERTAPYMSCRNLWRMRSATHWTTSTSCCGLRGTIHQSAVLVFFRTILFTCSTKLLHSESWT